MYTWIEIMTDPIQNSTVKIPLADSSVGAGLQNEFIKNEQ